MAKAKATTKQVLKEDGAGISVKAQIRTPEVLVRELHLLLERDSKRKFTNDEIELINGVSSEELALLIDTSATIEEERRDVESRVKKTVEPAKGIIREIGRYQNKKILTGTFAAAKITKSTKTIMGSVTDFIKLLLKEKKKKMIDALLNIKVTDTKKYLGEDLLVEHQLMKFEVEEFGSVSIKKLQE